MLEESIPIWYCEECGRVMLADEKELPVNPLKTMPKQACSCGSTTFKPETAVMDTWATSSISPFINKKWQEEDERKELQLPMGLRSQAHEIIRTWTFYTIVRSLYHTGKLPWKDIMISGFVLAKKGEKISKSKNNAGLSPSALINAHSADAVRYWAANARLGADTFFSEEDLVASKRLMNKLWNASKFAFMHLEDFDGNTTVDDPKMTLLPSDKWILEKAKATMNEVTEQLNEYEIGLSRHTIDEFFWSDFCDYYLEIAKDRLYKPEVHGSEERKGAQYALYHVLLTILKLYAIYIPHQTEYLYQNYFRQYEKALSLHQLQWEKKGQIDNELIEFGKALQAEIAEIRKYKSERNLSMKAEIEKFEIESAPQFKTYFELEEKDIKACGTIRILCVVRRIKCTSFMQIKCT